jgi:hypothetical protein
MDGLSQKKWRLRAGFQEKSSKKRAKGQRWPPF